MSTSQTKAADSLMCQEEAAISQTKLLGVNQVAKLLNCSARHVYRLADAGKMPRPIKLGALVRWSRSAIDEWISAGCPPCRREGRA